MSFQFEPIATVHSCYKEKFGIPRQPGLVREAEAIIELLPPYNVPGAVKGIEGFSHLWLLFVFHAVKQSDHSLTVRPPRLGGNERVGVFASRSTHRPNPIGQSVVELVAVECGDGGVRLRVRGADLLDGTPLLDIKPYIPYVDAIPGARSGFAAGAPPQLEVVWSAGAEAVLAGERDGAAMRRVIGESLAYDPRPAIHHGREEGRRYGCRMFHFDVKWHVAGEQLIIDALEPLGEE